MDIPLLPRQHQTTPSKQREGWPRRTHIYRLGFCFGIVCPFFIWILVIAGILPATPTDRVLSSVVLLAICSPLAAFWDNPGEAKRSMHDKLFEFAYYWLLVSGLAQTCWELPWFILDLTGLIHHAGPEDVWLWPWWSYGIADTRYLTSNPAIAGIEFCAGLVGPLELWTCYLFKQGQRILANWLALLIGVGLAWGGIIFFYAEIHVGFVNIHDGNFGFWAKWIGLNLPWLLSPFIFIPAGILELAQLYRKQGVRQYLQQMPRGGLEPPT